MAFTPKIDNLPAETRKRIMDMLLSGVSEVKVAKVAGVSRPAIHNYKLRVITPAIEAARKVSAIQPLAGTDIEQATETATLQRQIAKASPVMERLQNLWETNAEALQRAREAVKVVRDAETGEMLPAGQDLAVMAPLLGQGYKGVELLARLTGELGGTQSGDVNVSVYLGIPRQQEDDERGPVIDITPER